MLWKKARNHHRNLVGSILSLHGAFTNSFVCTEKIFSYLSADEIEKLKAEEEKKIATLSRADIGSLSGLEHSDDESVESQPTR